MSNTHELKTLPVYFNAVVRGDKTFEIRKNDRDFQTGDTVRLMELNPGYRPEPAVGPALPVMSAPPPPTLPRAPGYFTGCRCEFVITYILHGGQFGLEPGYVVLGFRDVIYSNEKE